MGWANRAHHAETPKQTSLCLRLRAPYFYPTPVNGKECMRDEDLPLSSRRGRKRIVVLLCKYSGNREDDEKDV